MVLVGFPAEKMERWAKGKAALPGAAKSGTQDGRLGCLKGLLNKAH